MLIAVAGGGLVASMVLAWGAYVAGAGRLRPGAPAWVGEQLLRDTVGLPSYTLGRVSYYAGALGLAVAWLGLVWLAGRRALGVGIRVVALIAVVWSLPLLVCPPVGSNDIYSYLAHGELAAEGLDPGEVTPAEGLVPTSPTLLAVDGVWRNVVSAYGPLATGLSEVAASASDGNLVAAVVLQRAFVAVGIVLMGIGVVVLARARGGARSPATVLAIVVASPLVMVHLVAGIHNEGLMIGLAVVGVAVATVGDRRSGRAQWVWWGAGVVLVGLGAAVKVSVIVAAAYLGWCGPGRGREVRPIGPRLVTGAVAGVITLGTIGAVALATGRGWGWIGGAGAGGKVLTLLSITSTIGFLLADPFEATRRDVQQGAIYNVVRGIGVAVSAVLAAALLWRAPRMGVDALGWALLAVALLGPAVHPWYLIWGLPFLALHHQGRAEPWLLAAPVVAAISAKAGGGGAWPNLGSQPWRILVVVAVGVVVAAGVRRFDRINRARDRRSGSAPTPDPTPARS